MKYWKISYYRTHNWIDAKYIKDEHAQGAINKARVKNIVDVQEITEKDYKAGLAKRKAAAQAKNARRADMRILTQKEWDRIPASYKGKWEPTPYNISRVESGELPAEYIGKRNMLTYEEGNGTVLLTEGYHFTVL